jgi:enhancer of polycomb-like protein
MPFSDYQETLSAPLPPSTFATFTVPVWVPTPSQLTRIARIIYPYWRERRTERGGHRIIPTLNVRSSFSHMASPTDPSVQFDETDTQNESYICFRRREIKAIRKTRASQVTSSDKLLRLQSELLSSLELAKNVVNRETLKREGAHQSQNVWEKRLSLVELKRKFPSLGGKEDEELLHDKERVPKRPRTDSNSAWVSYMLCCGIADHWYFWLE